jgi:hypothetical protein
MDTHGTQTKLAAASRRALSIAAALLVLGLGVISVTRPSRAASQGTDQARPGYGWPIKPFDEQHPVRGNFGDPRMIFSGRPTMAAVMRGTVTASFHTGVDICAPNGTAVYPVASGVVTSLAPDWITVDSGNGQAFEYWHITPTVRVGDHVEERQTVLGHIIRGQGHVHLTQIDNGRKVNPLAPGRLGPYADTTAPQVTSISFRRGAGGPTLLPNFLRGRVELIASAYDRPTLPAPGIWHDMPTTPALMTWHIENSSTGKVVVAERVAHDHRNTEPADTEFSSAYARGTFQNMAVFVKYYSYMQPGQFLFRLAPQGFDTRTLRDGVYDLVVTATDIRGNKGSLTQRFTVHNRSGWR